MKSAYELAMERLNKVAPTQKLTAQQKKELAELDATYAAKLADREIATATAIDKAYLKGDYDEAEKLQKQLLHDRQALKAELEEKKEQVRKR